MSFLTALLGSLSQTGGALAQSSKDPKVQLYAGLGSIFLAALEAALAGKGKPAVGATQEVVASSKHPLITGASAV